MVAVELCEAPLRVGLELARGLDLLPLRCAQAVAAQLHLVRVRVGVRVAVKVGVRVRVGPNPSGSGLALPLTLRPLHLGQGLQRRAQRVLRAAAWCEGGPGEGGGGGGVAEAREEETLPVLRRGRVGGRAQGSGVGIEVGG